MLYSVDMANMVLEYLPIMGFVLLFTAIISYISKFFGVVFGIILTILSFVASMMTIVVGGLAIIIVGFLIFPALIWIGYFLGRHIRGKSVAKNT